MTLRSEARFVTAYLEYKFAKSLSNAKQLRALSDVRLSIKSGLLAGEQRNITQPHLIIGSGQTADVILLDDSVEPAHAEVTVRRDWLGLKIGVTALAPLDLAIYGRVAKGESREVRGSTLLTLGTVSVMLEDLRQRALIDNAVKGAAAPVAPWLTASSIVGSRYFILLGAAILLVAGSFLISGVDLLPSGRPLVVERAALPARPVDVDSFLARLDAQITAAGLKAQLTVTRRPDGIVEVNGAPQSELYARWRDVLQWYDSQANVPTLVNRVQQGVAARDLPRIRYARFDEARPFIVLGDGRRAMEGETIADSWQVKSIKPDGVTLSLADKEVLVSYK